MLEEKIESLRVELEAMRKDLAEKHAQNRKDIHEWRNERQGIVNRIHEVELALRILVGSDTKPGLVDELRKELAQVRGTLHKIELAMAESSGVHTFLKWAIPAALAFLALIIPFLVVALQKVWGH